MINGEKVYWVAFIGAAGAIVSLLNTPEAKMRPLAFLVALLTGGAAAVFLTPLATHWLGIADPRMEGGLAFLIGIASKSAVQQISSIKIRDIVKLGRK